jgi:hypothetical protein
LHIFLTCDFQLRSFVMVKRSDLASGTTSISLSLIRMGSESVFVVEKQIRSSLHLDYFKANLLTYSCIACTCTMFVNYFRQSRIIYIFPKIYITQNVEVVCHDQRQPGTKYGPLRYTDRYRFPLKETVVT